MLIKRNKIIFLSLLILSLIILGLISISAWADYYGNQYQVISGSGTGASEAGDIDADDKCSMRFTAQNSEDAVTKIGVRVYENPGGADTFRFGLQGDDPGNPGYPSGTWLPTATGDKAYGDDAPSTNGILEITLTESAALTADTVYHLVVEPVGDPGAEYLTLGCVNPSNELYPYDSSSDTNANVLDYNITTTGQWEVQNKSPFYLLSNDSGLYEGNAYYDYAGEDVNANEYQGERFTVSGGDKSITTIGTVVKQHDGDEPEDSLYYSLYDVTDEPSLVVGGTLCTGADIDPDTTYAWQDSLPFAAKTLTDGNTYSLYFTSPNSVAGANYDVDQVKGSSGQKALTYDGATNAYYIYTTDGGTNWSSKDYYDMPFRFTLVPADPVIASSTHTHDAKSNVSAASFTCSAGTPTPDHYHYLWDQIATHIKAEVSLGTVWDGTEITENCTSDGDWYLHAISHDIADTESTNTDTFHIDYDGTAPQVQSEATAQNSTTVRVTYNEAVAHSASSGAEDENNYAIDGLTVSAVAHFSGDTVFDLTTTTQGSGTPYTIIITNVEDDYGNVIDPAHNTADFTGYLLPPGDPTITCTSGHSDGGKSNTAAASFTCSGAAPTPDHYHYLWNNTADPGDVSAGTQWDGTEITENCTSDGDWYLHVISHNSADTESTNTDTFHIDYNGTAPQVQSEATAQNSTTVRVTYNEAVAHSASSGAEDENNYAIDGLTVSSVTYISGNTIFDLTTTSQTSEQAYTITVSNVEDEYGNVIDSDHDEATFTGSGAGVEMLINGGFEDDGSAGVQPPTGWSIHGVGDGTYATSTEQKHGDNYSAKCIDDNTTASYLYQVVEVRGSTDYTISGWIYDNVDTAEGYLRVDWYESTDGGGSALSGGWESTHSSDGVTWEEMTTIIASNASAHSAKIKCYIKASEALGGPIYFDDISFIGPLGMSSAAANDASGEGPGIQAGDQVVITFTGETNGYSIDAANIDTVLAVSGKIWDGITANWTTTKYTDDTLTITFDGTGSPDVAPGDDITIGGTCPTTICDSSGTQKALGSPPSITGTFGIEEGDIIINEVMANPEGGLGVGEPEDTDEFIELYNRSSTTSYDVNGWYFTDGKKLDTIEVWNEATYGDITDPDCVFSTTIPPGGYAVILDQEYADVSQPYDFPSGTRILTCGNTTLGDELTMTVPVTLFDNTGSNISNIQSTYGTPALTGDSGWGGRDDDSLDNIPLSCPDGHSAERKNPAVGDVESNWACSAIIRGTPGASNSVFFLILSAQTMDYDVDGRIDGYKLTFSENIDDSTLTGYVDSTTPFATDTFLVAGYTGETIDPNGPDDGDTANDEILYLLFNESGSFDTGNKPELTTSGSTLKNATNSKILADVGTGDVSETDSAPPLPVSVVSDTILSGGNIPSETVLTISFSEIINVTGANVRDADFVTTPVAWPDGATVVYADDVAGDDKMIATLNPGTSSSSWTYDATFNRSPRGLVSPGSIKDMATVSNDARANATDLGILGLSEAPSATPITSIAQATDGSGYLSFESTISDNEHQTTRLKVEYSKDGGSNWYDPDLYSVTGTGSPALDNSLEYQITNIDTSSPNTLTIVWDTKSSLNGGGFLNLDRSDIMLRVTPRDDYAIGSLAISSQFPLDNLPPIPLANLGPSAVTSSSITWEWDPAITESQFNHYELWYGKDVNKVENRDATPPDGATEWDDSDDPALGTKGTNSTTISGLSSNTTYYAKIWAIDDVGNEISAPANSVVTETPSEGESSSEKWGCFIASAAYSGCTDGHRFITDGHRSQITDYRLPITDHPITILRRFRDQHLLTNSLGRVFVSAYHKISPPIAKFISDKEPLKAMVRFYLKPIVWTAKRITR